MFDFLFRRKKKAAESTSSAGDENKNQKESIEQRINREMNSLPAAIKNKVSDPSIKQRFVDLAKRMEKEGVDMNSPKAMKKWIKENEKQIKEEQAGGKVQQIIKTDEPGRNDPCPCGSGKKHKKCCGK